jgi:hypothetical protein
MRLNPLMTWTLIISGTAFLVFLWLGAENLIDKIKEDYESKRNK